MSRSAWLGLALCLCCAGCSTRHGTPTQGRIAPEQRAWRARVPTGEPVQTYATTLERLNPTRGVFDPTDGLTLEEAEAVALLFNAELRVARLKANVPLVGARNSGIPADPRLEFDLLRILESISSPWLLVSSLKFTIPLAGQLSQERAAAFAQADAALREAYLAEADLVTRLRLEWNAWTAGSERIELLDNYLASVREVMEIANQQRAAGQISVPQARVLELEEVTRAGELQTLRLELDRRVLTLKSLLGLAPTAEVLLLPGFSPDPPARDPAAEEAQLRSLNLELALAQAQFIAADKHLRHQASLRFPDLDLAPLLESEEGVSRLGAGVGISLPLWNRNRRPIAEAIASRCLAQEAYQARYQDLIARLARARSESDATAARSAWLKDKVAPLADTQLADLRQLGALGDMDVLILKDALSSVLEAKSQLLDARMERALAAVQRSALVDPLRTPLTQTPGK